MKHRRKLSYRVTQKAEERRSEASGFCCLALCPQGSTVALARPCCAVLFSGSRSSGCPCDGILVFSGM